MYVRLAFAVAAHLEPEILIVDEVLAVGDAAFQKKCLGKMSEVAKQGRTVLFVSHNMGVISTLTQRCIYMQGGQISAVGSSRDMVEMYLSRSLESDLTVVADLDSYRRARVDDSPVTIVRIGLKGHDVSCGIPTIEVGAKFTIEIDLCVLRKLHDANVTVIVKTSQGERVVVLVSWDRNYVLAVEPGRHVVTACISDLPLAPGHYFADIGIDPSMTALAYDSILDYPLLAVANTGQVTHWLERPWGALHCSSVDWNTARFEGS
jgi:lipopolysaccharide transport system ATP-binding protein